MTTDLAAELHHQKIALWYLAKLTKFESLLPESLWHITLMRPPCQETSRWCTATILSPGKLVLNVMAMDAWLSWKMN